MTDTKNHKYQSADEEREMKDSQSGTVVQTSIRHSTPPRRNGKKAAEQFLCPEQPGVGYPKQNRMALAQT